MERYLVKVRGRVQGVGFRYFAQYTAELCKVTGSVKNCDDGTVRIEAQGEEKALNKYFEKIREGNNRFTKIEEMVTKKIDVVPDEKNFKIKYY